MDSIADMWAREAINQRAADLERYQEAWAAYIGDMPDTLAIDPRTKINDNTKINYIRTVVDKGVSALFGTGVTFNLDAAADERTPPEEWLDECLRVNRFAVLLQKLGINGAIYGHPFLKIQLGAQYPRLINIPPEYVTVIGDPDDIEVVNAYIIQYTVIDLDGRPRDSRQTVERNEAGRWVVRDETRAAYGPWIVEQENVWPYDWPPIIDCQNLPCPNDYYGLPDVGRDVVALNRSVNFVLSNVQRIIRFHAHPKTVATGVTATQLDVSVDGLIILNAPGADLHNIEMTSDLSSSIEYFKRLREALHEVTRTPEVATGKLEGAGALSGVALRILYGPLEEKTNTKRLTYGEMLIELCRRLLEIGGFGNQNLVTIEWPAVVPANEVEERQVALMDEQIGASKDTLLTRLGFDADEEKEKRDAQGVDMADQLLTAFDRGAMPADNGNGKADAKRA